MVKWKKMNKKMAGLLLGVMMLFTASTTAFAYVDESAEASKVETTQTEQSTDKEEKKDEATNTNEVLPEDGTDKGTAFTTPGNGEVKDDITDDSTKEFLTVTTKNNNTFNLFYRPELYSSGGVSYSHQYEKICNSSYRDAAVGVFQPKCKRTAQKHH